MENFSYTNIFETKGIEYIVVIIFLAMLIPFWIFLNRKIQITQKIKRVIGYLSANILKIPQGVYHSHNHTWAFMEKDGDVKIGLDDLLVHITGEVKLHPAIQPGEIIQKGDLLLEIEQDAKRLKIFSPLSGKILNNNVKVNENPGIVNEDPFGEGWLFQLKPTNWKKETQNYYLAEEATEWSKNELQRFKDFLAESMKKYSPEQSYVVLQDGGEIQDHTLSELPDEIWHDFQEEFMAI